MPLLLLIPLLVVAVFVLWALLLPISLWQRYRFGRARRRAQPWVVRGNAWLLATAWMGSHWMPHALRDVVIGLCVGVLVGMASLGLTRFEREDGQMVYTPNRWLVLALTGLVAARIGFGLWSGWQHMAATSASPWAAGPKAGAVIGVGGVLLGYYLAYTWGLRARLSPRLSRSP